MSENGTRTNPFRQEIFDLKNQFNTILFSHLPRKTNKRADKLAGKILRIYKEDTLPNRTREDFVGQEDKYLNIPHLVCAEDFLDTIKLPVETNIKNIEEFESIQDKLRYYYLFEAEKAEETVDNIDDNNPIEINIYFIEKDSDGKLIRNEKISSEAIIQKKLTSKGLEMLADCFNQYISHIGENGQSIGLMFQASVQPLQKVEMLLRRRGILPIPDTPLTREFIAATKNFSQIVLNNDDKLIQQCLDLARNNKIKMKI